MPEPRSRTAFANPLKIVATAIIAILCLTVANRSFAQEDELYKSLFGMPWNGKVHRYKSEVYKSCYAVGFMRRSGKSNLAIRNAERNGYHYSHCPPC